MDITELYYGAMWGKNAGEEAHRLYEALQQTLQHNATQQQQQPLKEHLENLVDFLENLSMVTLSQQQKDFLTGIGLLRYLGVEGASFVNATVRDSNFDVASASAEMATVASEVKQAIGKCDRLAAVLESLVQEDPDVDADQAQFRIHFDSESGLRNMEEFRSRADEWYTIARGVGMLVGKAPGEMQVRSVSNGSVWLTIAGVTSLVLALAKLLKVIMETRKESVQIKIALEDHRMKKWANDKVIEGFEDSLRESKDRVLEAAFETAQTISPNMDGEVEKNVKNSIKNLADFIENGGDVDFVPRQIPAPSEEQPEQADGSSGEDQFKELRELAAVTNEVNTEKQEIKLLAKD